MLELTLIASRRHPWRSHRLALTVVAGTDAEAPLARGCPREYCGSRIKIHLFPGDWNDLRLKHMSEHRLPPVRVPCLEYLQSELEGGLALQNHSLFKVCQHQVMTVDDLLRKIKCSVLFGLLNGKPCVFNGHQRDLQCQGRKVFVGLEVDFSVDGLARHISFLITGGLNSKNDRRRAAS